MKITEGARAKKALEMIEEISVDAQSTNPQRDWKRSQDAVCEIYRLVHSIRSPGCRKNHKQWCLKIDTAIRAASQR